MPMLARRLAEVDAFRICCDTGARTGRPRILQRLAGLAKRVVRTTRPFLGVTRTVAASVSTLPFRKTRLRFCRRTRQHASDAMINRGARVVPGPDRGLHRHPCAVKIDGACRRLCAVHAPPEAFSAATVHHAEHLAGYLAVAVGTPVREARARRGRTAIAPPAWRGHGAAARPPPMARHPHDICARVRDCEPDAAATTRSL